MCPGERLFVVVVTSDSSACVREIDMPDLILPPNRRDREPRERRADYAELNGLFRLLILEAEALDVAGVRRVFRSISHAIDKLKLNAIFKIQPTDGPRRR
jgi:hypothetical protein